MSYFAAPESRKDEVIDLINYVFSHDHRPHDFPQLLPKEYAPGRGKAIHFVAEENGRFTACVAVRPFTLHIGGTVLKCGFIGSVSVHPYARGKGHMIALMDMADNYMREHGFDMAVLGGARQRYEHYGYVEGGLTFTYSVNQGNVRHALKSVCTDGLAIVPFETVHVTDAEALQQMLHAYVDRSGEFDDALRSWSGDGYAILRNGTFAGYLSSGSDHAIQELVTVEDLDPRAVIRLYMETRQLTSLHVTCSMQDVRLRRALDSFAEETQLTSCENLKILNWRNVLPAVLKYKQDCIRYPITDGSFSAVIDGQKIQLTASNGHVTCTDDCTENSPAYTGFDMIGIVFNTTAQLFGSTAVQAPRDWFPIPLGISPCDGF